eukprot:GHVN01048785.1.p1 GENE.GHVN01048785.1~~GHVN01048785.1.p1  ORF type:complete len:325 (+),score=44.62 GHVN01048785.1:66-1040(+)
MENPVENDVPGDLAIKAEGNTAHATSEEIGAQIVKEERIGDVSKASSLGPSDFKTSHPCDTTESAGPTQSSDAAKFNGVIEEEKEGASASSDPPAPTEARVHSAEEIQVALREILRPENMSEFTKRKARDALEEKLGYAHGDLLKRKVEIHGFIDDLVSEYLANEKADRAGGGSVDENGSGDESEEPKQPQKRASAKRKAQEPDSSASDGASESDASSDSGNKRRRRGAPKRTAQPKKRLKAMQSKLMTRATFTDNAKVMDVTMGELKFQCNPREFSTGSMGWFYGSKVQIMVGETPLHCQLTVNCAVLGSKEWNDGKRKKPSD